MYLLPHFLLLICLPLLLISKEIKLSPQEEANWHIQTLSPQMSTTIPLGAFTMQVTIPPTLLRGVSLPFDAQIHTLHVASHQKVQKGDILATVGGTAWIDLQRETIAHAIELRHQTQLAKRKNRLCKEGIIPKKECLSVNASLKNAQTKLAASKTMLQSFGASSIMIDTLLDTLHISPSLSILSPISGTIQSLHASVGETHSTSQALCVIQKRGDLWLESYIPHSFAKSLQEKQDVKFIIHHKHYKATILQRATTIDTQNQTQYVRFALEDSSDFMAGMRPLAQIIIPYKTFYVPKKSVIKEGQESIVFMKYNGVYHDKIVQIVAEDTQGYYVQYDEDLKHPIAISSIAILKSMLGDEDE